MNWCVFLYFTQVPEFTYRCHKRWCLLYVWIVGDSCVFYALSLHNSIVVWYCIVCVMCCLCIKQPKKTIQSKRAKKSNNKNSNTQHTSESFYGFIFVWLWHQILLSAPIHIHIFIHLLPLCVYVRVCVCSCVMVFSFLFCFFSLFAFISVNVCVNLLPVVGSVVLFRLIDNTNVHPTTIKITTTALTKSAKRQLLWG